MITELPQHGHAALILGPAIGGPKMHFADQLVNALVDCTQIRLRPRHRSSIICGRHPRFPSRPLGRFNIHFQQMQTN